MYTVQSGFNIKYSSCNIIYRRIGFNEKSLKHPSINPEITGSHIIN